MVRFMLISRNDRGVRSTVEFNLAQVRIGLSKGAYVIKGACQVRGARRFWQVSFVQTRLAGLIAACLLT